MKILPYFNPILNLTLYRQKYRTFAKNNKVNIRTRLPIPLQNIDITHLLIKSATQSTQTSNYLMLLLKSVFYAFFQIIRILIMCEILNYNMLLLIVLSYLRSYAVKITNNSYDFLRISMGCLVEVVGPSIAENYSLCNSNKECEQFIVYL